MERKEVGKEMKPDRDDKQCLYRSRDDKQWTEILDANLEKRSRSDRKHTALGIGSTEKHIR